MPTAKKFEDKWLGCFMGVAIGDALGMPVETMTHAEITAATGGKGITDYLDPVQTKIEHRLQKSQTTDDTALTLAVARSLIRRTAFASRDQALELAACYLTDTIGWGDSTSDAAAELLLHFSTDGKTGRAPSEAPAYKKGRGSGNGVAMKIAPLALWHSAVDPFCHDELDEDVVALGRLTHSEPTAWIAAAALAAVIRGIMTVPKTPFTKIAARHHVTGEDVLGLVKRLEETHCADDGSERFSSRLVAASKHLKSAEALRLAAGTGFSALESVALALGIFMRHPDDFEAAVLEAVNAGGDTDTVASMVGAMVGANVGLAHIPKRFVDGLDPISSLQVMSTAAQLLIKARKA